MSNSAHVYEAIQLRDIHWLKELLEEEDHQFDSTYARALYALTSEHAETLSVLEATSLDNSGSFLQLYGTIEACYGDSRRASDEFEARTYQSEYDEKEYTRWNLQIESKIPEENTGLSRFLLNDLCFDDDSLIQFNSDSELFKYGFILYKGYSLTRESRNLYALSLAVSGQPTKSILTICAALKCHSICPSYAIFSAIRYLPDFIVGIPIRLILLLSLYGLYPNNMATIADLADELIKHKNETSAGLILRKSIPLAILLAVSRNTISFSTYMRSLINENVQNQSNAILLSWPSSLEYVLTAAACYEAINRSFERAQYILSFSNEAKKGEYASSSVLNTYQICCDSDIRKLGIMAELMFTNPTSLDIYCNILTLLNKLNCAAYISVFSENSKNNSFTGKTHTEYYLKEKLCLIGLLRASSAIKLRDYKTALNIYVFLEQNALVQINLIALLCSLGYWKIASTYNKYLTESYGPGLILWSYDKWKQIIKEKGYLLANELDMWFSVGDWRKLETRFASLQMDIRTHQSLV